MLTYLVPPNGVLVVAEGPRNRFTSYIPRGVPQGGANTLSMRSGSLSGVKRVKKSSPPYWTTVERENSLCRPWSICCGGLASFPESLIGPPDVMP